MASRVAILRSIVGNTGCSTSGSKRWVHNVAAAIMTPSLSNCLHHPSLPPPLLFPWSFPNPGRDGEWRNDVGIGGDLGGLGFPGFPGGEAMELAVPKRKVTPHKRGIRNGPKALKPTPVIIRCRVCGRVKLPHFYCCSGRKETVNEKNG
ncbi:unnamed protein product [Linum tenue]|uniref:Large ribosomal subunit protein bL32m n=1 Tax=Linum tenue TaxID=586396 RepID=A0AAV0Q830_9ROSI|nr:unnamed protein product [Linum tenue]CAI0543896.1 unnamed protein product [Linum tenue]